MWRPTLIALALAGASMLPGRASAAQHEHLTRTSIIARVAALYGDPRPHLMGAQTTHTEVAPHPLMYFIKLRGRFHRGHVGATYLYFSALASRWYVWGVQGYDAHHHLKWLDATLPKHRTRLV